MEGDIGLEGIFKEGPFGLDGVDELGSQVEKAGMGSGRCLGARTAIRRCGSLRLRGSSEGETCAMRRVFVDLANQLGHVGPGGIQTGSIKACNVALSLVAL